jgi:signal transduction histidine kinase
MTLHVNTEARYPTPLELTVFYVVSEALTNTIKHANASWVEVVVEDRDTALVASIRDDGAGGADPRSGSGLIGLRDRVEAIGGSMQITSPVAAGTTIHISLPIDQIDCAASDGRRISYLDAGRVHRVERGCPLGADYHEQIGFSRDSADPVAGSVK